MWSRAWRWMVWVVALALPLQAMAAASMLHCASHAAVVQTAAPPHAHAGHDGHGAHAMPDVAIEDNADAAASTCSACAACCAAMALPGALPDLPHVDAAGDRHVSSPSGVPPFLTGGPERPPRLSRA